MKEIMRKTLYIIRGLPGTGKFGGMKSHSYAADDWFYGEDGEYTFNPAELGEAHDECNSRVRGAMMSGVENICVCNTFTQAWEAAPYFKLAGDFRYTPVVLECQSEFGNIHGCPQSKIDEMVERWEPIDERCAGRWLGKK